MEDTAAELEQALADRRRLARYRRILVTILLILGAALFVLTRLEAGAPRRAVALLTIAWFGLWLPTFRVVIFERYTQRLIERLAASPQRSRR
ncbi:MAG TPA: hypothetical protein VHH90_08535 [Polyangia bacterium]|nr:hypothetical protein [Polyangia bacterium]